jgi:hypothetical protein
VESLWRKQTPNIEPLKGKENTLSTDTHWDVIVVGAGLAGILIAYYLKESGKKVLVLETDKIASGQTEGTTAKITSQHDIKYTKLIDEMGVETARLYAQANESAIREYERLVKERNIECDFRKCPAYLYTTGEEVLLMEEAMVAASFGIDASRNTVFPRTLHLVSYYPYLHNILPQSTIFVKLQSGNNESCKMATPIFREYPGR